MIFLGGINDLGIPFYSGIPPVVDAQQIIDGYREIIARVHARRLKIIGGTMTPVKGSMYSYPICPDSEAQRQIINHWIRTSGAFDAVVDFDAAVRDPADPEAWVLGFQSGDFLHPNDLGYSIMAQKAEEVFLDLLAHESHPSGGH